MQTDELDQAVRVQEHDIGGTAQKSVDLTEIK